MLHNKVLCYMGTIWELEGVMLHNKVLCYMGTNISPCKYLAYML